MKRRRLRSAPGTALQESISTGPPASKHVEAGSRLARVGVIAAVTSRLFGRLVGIAFLVVLARTSSDQTVAVYGYLLGTVTLVASVSDLGVASVAGRDVAAGRYAASAGLSAALPIQVATLAAAAALTLGLVIITGPTGLTTPPVVLTLLFLLLNGLVNLWGELLRGQGRVVAEALLQTLSATMLVGGGLVVVAQGGGATPLLATVAGKEFVVLALSWVLLRPERMPGVVRPGNLVRQSLSVAFAGSAAVLMWRQGALYVGATGSVAALAVYVVASRFLDAGVTLANTIGFGLLPGVSSYAHDSAAFRQAARRYLSVAGTIGLVASVLGLLLAGPLTTGLFGSRWSASVPGVRFFGVAGGAVLVGYIAWFLLLARREQRWIAVGAGVGAVVAVLATLASAAPFAQSTAAAAGTAAGAAVMAAVLVGRVLVITRSEDVGRPSSSAAMPS